MITIRIFDTKREAEAAKKVLVEGGIIADITEDKFEGVPIQEYGVSARFRLNVEDRDFPKTTKFLAEKLKKKSNS